MGQRKKFDKAFKEQVVLRILANESTIVESAKELDVHYTTVRDWVRYYKRDGANAFPGSGNLTPEEDEMRKLRKQLADLKEENEILKKAGGLLREKSEVIKFKFIYEHRFEFQIAKMCQALNVSRSGYYAYVNRPESKRSQENRELLKTIKAIHESSRRAYGSPQITNNLPPDQKASRGRVARLMQKNGIRSKVVKKYKATTNSAHDLPVAENLLNQDFSVSKPNEKWLSDITYIQTAEGWLYLAGVMDLYGRRLIGWAMDSRMKTELISAALKQAIGRAGYPKGVIIHSDRGVQYASKDYQKLLAKHEFICSMSRKGNCHDNSPMESFWGKLKMEWLNDYTFKSRNEAKKAVFEYIELFYNRRRTHSANQYVPPFKVKSPE
ncbi:IS3 family transposase [Cohnella soli]|uniref:IS3 family transposase n=1 Tax=Cohnella soli TaxID=425005 RepID=A0ABW0HZX9_9BACL